jgi:hypothetical protein
MFSNRFDILMSKNNFLKIKKIYIILMHFQIKNILKSNHYHTLKHPLYKWYIVYSKFFSSIPLTYSVIYAYHKQ